jgi:hypothetical protein
MSARFGFQHGGQFRHQHQLAGLWRRIDDGLPGPDAGPDGAELPFRGHRHRCRIAFIRGFARHSAAGIGNAWADLFRATTWILLPLSLVFALFLASQGVIQNFAAYQDVTTLQVTNYENPARRRRPSR